MSKNFKLVLSEQEIKDLVDFLDIALKKDGLLVLSKVVTLYNVVLGASEVLEDVPVVTSGYAQIG